MRRHVLATIAILSVLPALWGCGLGSGPPPRQYTLSPPTNFAPGVLSASWSLSLDEPTAPHEIDVSRIALMDGPFQVEYYADVEWTDDAPAMVQVLLLQGFRNAARLRIVASSRQTLATDFLLLSNLRKFQVEKDASGTSRAVVVLETTLLRMPRRAPIASARFAEATPVAADSIDGVTAAFNTSVDNMIRQVIAWTIQTGSAAGTNAEDREAWLPDAAEEDRRPTLPAFNPN